MWVRCHQLMHSILEYEPTTPHLTQSRQPSSHLYIRQPWLVNGASVSGGDGDISSCFCGERSRPLMMLSASDVVMVWCTVYIDAIQSDGDHVWPYKLYTFSLFNSGLFTLFVTLRFLVCNITYTSIALICPHASSRFCRFIISRLILEYLILPNYTPRNRIPKLNSLILFLGIVWSNQ